MFDKNHPNDCVKNLYVIYLTNGQRLEISALQLVLYTAMITFLQN